MTPFLFWFLALFGAALLTATAVIAVREPKRRLMALALAVEGIALASRLSNLLFNRLLLQVNLPQLFDRAGTAVGGGDIYRTVYMGK